MKTASKGNRWKKLHKPLILFLSLALLVGFACYSGLKVEHYTLTSPHIVEPVRMVLVSDLHSKEYGKNQQSLLDCIAGEKPDLILLAGDIVDDWRPAKGAEDFVRGAVEIAPVYYVTGNHEYRTGNIGGIKEWLASCGVHILSDGYELAEVNGNRILLAGVEDPLRSRYLEGDYNQAETMNEALSELPEDVFSVLLAHRPERIDSYRSYGFHLVLSGHAHGGQVRIPLLVNGLFAPNQGFFPDYAGGLYRHGTLAHIVSRGAANNVPLPRVFNPPEIVVIDLYNQPVLT